MVMQEKEETEIGKYRQTLCFKARPLPDFYKERKSPKNEIHKVNMFVLTSSNASHWKPKGFLMFGYFPAFLQVPVTPQSKNPGKKPTPSTVESSTSLPPSGASIKSIGSKNVQGRNNQTPGRNYRTPTCSLISRSFKTTRENTSPNIQLEYPKLENKFLLEQKWEVPVLLKALSNFQIVLITPLNKMSLPES